MSKYFNNAYTDNYNQDIAKSVTLNKHIPSSEVGSCGSNIRSPTTVGDVKLAEMVVAA